MELVGRITKDAIINQLQDERKVVNFSIAINDYYKPKNSEDGVKITTYVNCSYWISSKIAERLTKGTLIEINGRAYTNAYIGTDGEAKASLNCHVNNIKIHSFGNQQNDFGKQENSEAISNTIQQEAKEDLPF